MKKKIISCIMVGLLISLIPTTAFAGTWKSEGYGYWTYLKDNGSYAKEEWLYYNGSWYFFNGNYMASDIIMSSSFHNTGGYSYYFYKTGEMASGGFIDIGGERVFADKDGHLVDGLFMVDGVLYEAPGKHIYNDIRSIHYIFLIKSNGEQEDIKCSYSNGKILDPNGKPFAANSEIYTQIKYLPKYDSKGNLIGEIKNENKGTPQITSTKTTSERRGPR